MKFKKTTPALTKNKKDMRISALLAIMMACIVYIFYALKSLQDTLIISRVGVELFSTIELFGVLPGAFAFTLFYTKLSSHFKRTQIFYFLTWFFLSFFIIFDLFLYPNTEKLHFDLSYLSREFPLLKYQFLMISNWTYSLFYIFASLWGNVMLALMFWQIANQIFSTHGAKIYYPLIALLGQMGSILSGVVIVFFTNKKVSTVWSDSMHYILICILIAGIIISITFFILTNYFISHEKINTQESFQERISLIDSLSYVIHSKYIRYLVLVLFCYGICTNLSEALWKRQISDLYQTSMLYTQFIGRIQIIAGIVSIAAITLSFLILRKIKWYTAALLTPLMSLVLGIPFFLFTLYEATLPLLQQVVGYSALFISVVLGGIHNIFYRSVKYSFFEPTKEIVYIPLNDELKTKGKAVADLLGERMGKASSSIVQYSILSLTIGSTLLSIAPVLFGLFLLFIGIWIFSLSKINKELMTTKKHL